MHVYYIGARSLIDRTGTFQAQNFGYRFQKYVGSFEDVTFIEREFYGCYARCSEIVWHLTQQPHTSIAMSCKALLGGNSKMATNQIQWYNKIADLGTVPV